MAQIEPSDTALSIEGTVFATTHWSVILSAGQADSARASVALETLCRAYWYPVYAFVRRRGYRPEDAQDLTQGFFAQLLARHRLQVADPARGRFRGFLLTCLRNFLANEWDKACAAKRGGGQTSIPFDDLLARQRYEWDVDAAAPPDVLYERSWAMTLLEQVRERLREEYARAAKSDRFDWLERFLPGGRGEPLPPGPPPSDGPTSGAQRSEVHRFRQRYRDLLRREIAHTVQHAEDIDDEIRHLIAVLSR